MSVCNLLKCNIRPEGSAGGKSMGSLKLKGLSSWQHDNAQRKHDCDCKVVIWPQGTAKVNLM